MSILSDLRRRREEEQTKDQRAQAAQEALKKQRLEEKQAAEQASRQVEQQKKASVQTYHELVMDTLEQLRQSVYPKSAHKTDYGEPLHFVVKEFPEDYRWCLGYEKPSAIGGYFVNMIAVSLEFDNNGQPTCFVCERFQESYREFEGKPPGKLREPVEADLSRDNLVEALRDLHLPQKKPWQFWQH